MGKLNKIVFPLPAGFKSAYENLGNAALFSGDTLVLPVTREDYNAPNPKTKEVREGVTTGVVDLKIDYYKPEFVSRDSRSIIKDILEGLEEVGNLDAIAATVPAATFPNVNPIAMYDYHRYDTLSDRIQGYTLRIGVMTIEDLKGSFRSSDGVENYNEGTRVVFTHMYKIVGGSLVDARSR